MLISLRSTPDNDRGPRFAEQVFAAIHQANRSRFPVTLEFARHGGMAGLFVRCPDRHEHIVRSAFQGNFPYVQQDRLPENALDIIRPGYATWFAEVKLVRQVYPIMLHGDFDDMLSRLHVDPVSGILSALKPTQDDPVSGRIQIHAWPARRRKIRRARWTARKLSSPFFQNHERIARWFANAAMIENGLARLLAKSVAVSFAPKRNPGPGPGDSSSAKTGRQCFEVRVRIIVSAPYNQKKLAVTKVKQLFGSLGQLGSPNLAEFKLGRLKRGKPRSSKRKGSLFSDRELATIFHPPTETVRAPMMQKNESRKLEPPVFLPSPAEPDVMPVGKAVYHERQQFFGIQQTDRFQHCVISGRSGQGKSVLLENMIANDMQRNRGVAIIDPHGDLAHAVMNRVPGRRIDDVVVISPGDRSNPPAWNPLRYRNENHKAFVIEDLMSGLMRVFKFDESVAPRMMHIIRNGLLLLMDDPDASMLSLDRLLRDSSYRIKLADQASDPEIRAFWQEVFEPLADRTKREWVAPVQNKLGAFLTNPITRNILGRPQSKINLRQLMDDGKIVIVNLGNIPETTQRLFGILLTSAFLSAAKSRSDIPESNRVPFFFYVDEFQTMASESFEAGFSQLRKYRFGMTCAHQYIGQLNKESPTMVDAIYGNVGSIIAFNVGPDSEFLAEQFGGDVKPSDLQNLPKFNAYMRLLVDGTPKGPFSVETLPPHRKTRAGWTSRIKKRSRNRFSHKFQAKAA